jgi:hypothetical protein
MHTSHFVFRITILSTTIPNVGIFKNSPCSYHINSFLSLKIWFNDHHIQLFKTTVFLLFKCFNIIFEIKKSLVQHSLDLFTVATNTHLWILHHQIINLVYNKPTLPFLNKGSIAWNNVKYISNILHVFFTIFDIYQYVSQKKHNHKLHHIKFNDLQVYEAHECD